MRGRGAPEEPGRHRQSLGGTQKEREAQGWGHPRVHRGANAAKCQGLAQEGPQEELEWWKREGLMLSPMMAYEPGRAAGCGDRQGVLTCGGCRNGIFLVPGLGTGASLEGVGSVTREMVSGTL